jgi:tRNA1(Val) A37 N6-methylase TrmN6
LSHWTTSAARLLKPHGVLTLIWRADALDEVLTVLSAAFGGVAVLPVYPRADAPAIRVLVRAVKGGKTTRADLPGLVLNGDDGKPTAAAEAVLRGGECLSLANL